MRSGLRYRKKELLPHTAAAVGGLCTPQSNHVLLLLVGAFLCGCFVGGCLVAEIMMADISIWSPSLSVTTPWTTTGTAADISVRAPSWSKPEQCSISLGRYHGREAHPNQDAYGKPLCLVNTKFLKVKLHKVQLSVPGSTNNNKVVDDWIWIDYHDRVNILVQTKDDQDFLIFEQTKYALEGRMSLAIVGGIVEPGEDPRQTAQREVEEELQQLCVEFHFLGRFVTDVNRGMGWLNSFLATGCSSIHGQAKGVADGQEQEEKQQVGAADTEVQVLKHLSLTELREAFEAGRFLEAQWSATIGLALRHPTLVQQP